MAFIFSAPVLAVLIAVAWWNPKGSYWGGVEPPKAQVEAYSVERLRHDAVLTPAIYDQAKLDRLIREPQNTVSNLAYAAVGLAIFLAGTRRVTRSLGVAGMFLGVGSGLYHASLLVEWRLMDILGVYAALMALVMVGTGAIMRNWIRGKELAVVVVTWVVAVVMGIFRNDVRVGRFKPFDSTTVVVALVAAGSGLALLAWRRTRDRRRGCIALGVLAVSAPIAFFGGQADRFGGLLANPEAWVQGHAVWHTMGAVALLAAYEVYAATGFDRSVFEEGDGWGLAKKGGGGQGIGPVMG